jgi:hypothetical protein
MRFANFAAAVLAWVGTTIVVNAQAAGAMATGDPAFRNAVPVCKAEQLAKQFDGKVFLIAGLFRQTPHGGVFYGADCSHQLIQPAAFVGGNAEDTLAALIHADDTKPVEVVYLARFQIVHGLLCNVVMCFSYMLDAGHLVAARTADNGPAHHRE